MSRLKFCPFWGVVTVCMFVCLFVSPHMLTTRYNQILLTPLILKALLDNKDNQDDQENQYDLDGQGDQEDQDDQDGQDDQDDQDD